MQIIPLQSIPNQQFQVTLDGQFYDIQLRSIGDMMYATISMNNVQIVSGVRCVVGTPLLPYRYLQGDGGNFVFVTTSGQNPQYENFAAGDVLLYASPSEIPA